MKRLTTEKFIEKAKITHGDKYDYSRVEYLNNHAKVCIICPEHGEFWQNPNNHIKGSECPMCGKEKRNSAIRLTTEKFIERAKKIHGNRYDYSNVDYKGCFEKVKIICPEHGEFLQIPNDHISGCGCPKCANNQKYATEEFIERAKNVHGDEYDYSNVVYKGCFEKVKIICHKKDKYGNEHGEFLQIASNHLQGCGCPKCKTYKLEAEIRNFLIENKIEYEEHKTFSWFKNEIGTKTLDFYLPKYNAAIECQGIQHFVPTDFANKGEEWANEKFKYTVENDKFKLNECRKRGINVYYYSNLGIKYPYAVFEDKNKLFLKIKQDGNNIVQSK